MYISNFSYRLSELTSQHLEVCSKLLAEAFLTMNRVWATMSPTLEEV